MLRWVTDVSRGDWLAPRLGPFGGWVGSVVPRGYEAYARVLHRVDAGGEEWLRWADVAAATGAVLHPAAQWWRVARLPEPYASSALAAHGEPWPDWYDPVLHAHARRGEPGEWLGNGPRMGRLDPVQLAAVVDVLRGFADPDAVTVAFWEGSSWQGGTPLVMWAPARRRHRHVPLLRRRVARRALPSLDVDPDLDPEVLSGPRLELPGRDHVLFAGSLRDVAALADATATADVTPFRPDGRTPSLLWPDDRSWCLATEVDFDSTLVGGPRTLIDAILADPALEAFEVGEDDSLMHDGDAVNR